MRLSISDQRRLDRAIKSLRVISEAMKEGAYEIGPDLRVILINICDIIFDLYDQNN